MRYTSAVEILRYLRSSYGEKPSISAVCRGISLSYQPTYYHIKELEKLGVVATHRVGKESPCELVNSPATALWLGLICEADSQAAGGIARKLLEGLRPHLYHDRNALDCIAFVGTQSHTIAVSRAGSDDAGRRLAHRCKSIAPTVSFSLFTVDEFISYLATGAGCQCVREAVIISGHQQLWHYALQSGEGQGLVCGLGTPRTARTAARMEG